VTTRRKTDLVGDDGAISFRWTVPRYTNGCCWFSRDS